MTARRRVLRLAFLLALAAAIPLHAATFLVDRTDDDPSATTCDALAPNDCSLRGALSRANAAPDADEIVLPAGTYVLSVPSPCTFLAKNGGSFFVSVVPLCLNSDLKLTGAGRALTVIQGNDSDRVIAASVGTTVTLAGLTVAHGGAAVFGFQIGGGSGILNHGTMTVSDSIVTANIGGNGGGGGVYNFGTLTLVRSLIDTNVSSGAGGGVLNSGDAGGGVLRIQSSTLSGNSTSQQGGGLINLYGGTVILGESTVSGNASTFDGGGVFNGSFSTLTAINSTISDNQADGGAGIGNAQNATAHLRNVTIAGNVAGTASNGRGIGGGINTAGALTLQNSIIAGNLAYNAGPDCYHAAGSVGSVDSLGYDLIQDPASCAISGNLAGNILGQDPQLGVLTDNGGSTRTRAPAAASPVVNAGSPASPGSGSGSACAATDQRGFLRPFGSACDIGAFERTGAFALNRISPTSGGDTGTVSVLVSGNGFASGTSVKLTRTGQPDIVGAPQHVDTGGSAISATFDLAGKPLGAWNVVVVNPGGTTQTLAGGFTVEATRAPQLWVEVVGRFFRPGRPSRLTILYGNRGNVDALAVPLTLSIPEGYAPRRFFTIKPPPAQPGQQREDFTNVPVGVDIVGEDSHFAQIPLLLPIVPAGFTGSLQIGVTLPIGAQESMLVTAIGDPLYNPGLDAQAVAKTVASVQAYLAAQDVIVPPSLVPALTQYAVNQFDKAVELGRSGQVATMGTQTQVYSAAQMQLDLVLYAAALVAAAPHAAALPGDAALSADAALAGVALRGLDVRYRALAAAGRSALRDAVRIALRQMGELLHLAYRSLTVIASWLGPTEAYAQTKNCPPVKKGDVLLEECSGPKDSDAPFFPPAIPPPPGCNPKDPSTFPKCQLTPAHCDSLPGYKVVKASDGSPFCVPEKPGKECSKLAANPVGSNQGCSIFPLRPRDSVDPNDKVGSLGATGSQYLLASAPLTYKIFFENLPTATAAAQEVQITDQLDAATMDFDTFSLGPISFGRDVTLTPPPGVQQYTGGIDLRPAKNLIATVIAGLDKSTGLLRWRFTSIDPDTGQLTDDPNAGFLPPNVQSPDGEGSVAFTVERKAGLASATTICNQASIVFDLNAPIATPQWCNTLDTVKPSSHVLPLPAAQSSNGFLVQWAGSDLGSGVSDYTVYVSVDGGAFTVFVANSPNTTALFTGTPGHSYAFYSVARDQAGNEEASVPAVQASTMTLRELAFTPVTPCRLLDTRNAVGAFGPRSGRNYAASDAARVAQAGGNAAGCGIPVGPSALAVTLTAVLPDAGGNLVAYASGGAVPLASTLSFFPGQIVANTSIVPITPGVGDSLAIFNNSDGNTPLVADVVGYFWEEQVADCGKVSQSQVVGVGSSTTVTASCGAGFVAVGGGCSTGTGESVTWLDRSNSASGSGYKCGAINTGAANVTVNTDVLCCRRVGR